MPIIGLGGGGRPPPLFVPFLCRSSRRKNVEVPDGPSMRVRKIDLRGTMILLLSGPGRRGKVCPLAVETRTAAEKPTRGEKFKRRWRGKGAEPKIEGGRGHSPHAVRGTEGWNHRHPMGDVLRLGRLGKFANRPSFWPRRLERIGFWAPLEGQRELHRTAESMNSFGFVTGP